MSGNEMRSISVGNLESEQDESDFGQFPDRFQVIPTKRLSCYDNPIYETGPLEGQPDGNPSPSHYKRRGSRDASTQVMVHDMLPDDPNHTVHQKTVDKLPSIEYYRNDVSVADAFKRPTLDQLRDPKFRRLSRNFMSKDNCIVDENARVESAVKFGWIRGVLLRCILSIWGVMLFLRMGWMTGQAGIVEAISIILLSTVITTTTTLSMSAICTNGEVRGGGAYYLLSRSLGPEFGGSIGAIFTVANVVAVSMFVLGAAETTRDILRAANVTIVDDPVSDLNDVRICGVGFMLLVASVVTFGMAFESKAQLILLAMLLVALANYFCGTFVGTNDQLLAKGFVGWSSTVATDNLLPSYTKEHNFFTVFSIFFPSVTGIMAGANISGDLKNPSKAIPKGTLLAIFITSASYILVVIFLGCTVTRWASGHPEEGWQALNCTLRDCEFGLIGHTQIMEATSLFGPLIYAGTYAATLSSALTHLVSAPRVFQALCRDQILPYIYFFAKGHGPSDDPRRATVLVFFIALAVVCIGDLDTVAPLISNFYIASHCLINFACFHASYVKSPGFRPSFKFYNKWLSLFSALLCLVVMFIMDWKTALLTFLVVLLLYVYIDKKSPGVNWGSSSDGLYFKSALDSIIRLNKIQEHVKNYRPSILVLSGNPRSRSPLVHLSCQITKKLGLCICGHIVTSPMSLSVREAVAEDNVQWLERKKWTAFYSLIESDNLLEGVKSLLQVSGLGRMRPNIVMMGFKHDWVGAAPDKVDGYLDIIHYAFDLNLALGILRLQEGLNYSAFFESNDGLPYDNVLDNEETVTLNGNQKKKNKRRVDIPTIVIETDLESNGSENGLTAAGLHRPRLTSANVKQAMRVLQEKQTGCIDVWWLYDDGGLTVLISYVLSIRSEWKSCRVRVFSVAQNRNDIDSIQVNLASLLKKFRVEFSQVKILTGVSSPPKEETIDQFKKLVQNFFTRNDNHQRLTRSDLHANKTKTHRMLKLRELLVENSSDAALIVMTLPLPRKGPCPALLYMAWMETLTHNMPPFLLLRGNQTNVLTFYS